MPHHRRTDRNLAAMDAMRGAPTRGDRRANAIVLGVAERTP